MSVLQPPVIAPGEGRDHKETALSPWRERGDREAVGEGWIRGLTRHCNYEMQYEPKQTHEAQDAYNQ
jgi:hypothetical protein